MKHQMKAVYNLFTLKTQRSKLLWIPISDELV